MNTIQDRIGREFSDSKDNIHMKLAKSLEVELFFDVISPRPTGICFTLWSGISVKVNERRKENGLSPIYLSY